MRAVESFSTACYFASNLSRLKNQPIFIKIIKFNLKSKKLCYNHSIEGVI